MILLLRAFSSYSPRMVGTAIKIMNSSWSFCSKINKWHSGLPQAKLIPRGIFWIVDFFQEPSSHSFCSKFIKNAFSPQKKDLTLAKSEFGRSCPALLHKLQVRSQVCWHKVTQQHPDELRCTWRCLPSWTTGREVPSRLWLRLSATHVAAGSAPTTEQEFKSCQPCCQVGFGLC